MDRYARADSDRLQLAVAEKAAEFARVTDAAITPGRPRPLSEELDAEFLFVPRY